MDARTLAIAASSAALLGLSGCGTSLLAGRSTNPVIQDFAVRWWSDTSSLSTTASRRLALMVHKPDENGRKSLVTCAEPPPDVGETFAKAIAAQLEVSTPKAAGALEVGGSFANQVATSIAPLMVRSQGLQILRDSAYTLCVDYMNGWIKDSESYMRIKQDRFDKALQLIRDELPSLPGRVAALPPPDLPAVPTLPARIRPEAASRPAAASAPAQ